MIIVNLICYILTIIGGLNWGLVGIFDFNLVSFLTGGFRTGFGIAIYVLIFLATLWLIFVPFVTRGRVQLCDKNNDITL